MTKTLIYFAYVKLSKQNKISLKTNFFYTFSIFSIYFFYLRKIHLWLSIEKSLGSYLTLKIIINLCLN